MWKDFIKLFYFQEQKLSDAEIMLNRFKCDIESMKPRDLYEVAEKSSKPEIQLYLFKNSYKICQRYNKYELTWWDYTKLPPLGYGYGSAALVASGHVRELLIANPNISENLISFICQSGWHTCHKDREFLLKTFGFWENDYAKRERINTDNLKAIYHNIKRDNTSRQHLLDAIDNEMFRRGEVQKANIAIFL